MIFIHKFMTGILSAALLTGCANASKPDSEAVAAPQATPVATVTAAPAQINDALLNAVYLQYTHLTEALVKGDINAAKITANAIITGAAALTESDLLKSKALLITKATDIESQRTAYAGLSTAMISLVKSKGMSEGALYIDFCPMAMKDNGAYWISSGKEIRNPYMGESMLTCGNVKETIN